MLFDWQNLIAIVLVAAAAGYLGRRGWTAIAGRRRGCGACSTCPAESIQSANGKPLVTLAPRSVPQNTSPKR
ncbi:MAG TPA: hypothetical protein VKB78_10470 [Pirellulales bacterium]|nr:hypothetical protein [Pirellulales bacterium]